LTLPDDRQSTLKKKHSLQLVILVGNHLSNAMSERNLTTGQWLIGRRRNHTEYWLENYDSHTFLVKRNGAIFGDITAVYNNQYALSVVCLWEGFSTIRNWEQRADNSDHYLGTFNTDTIEKSFRRMVFMDTVAKHQVWKKLMITNRYHARQHELWRHKTLGKKMWDSLPYEARLSPPKAS
jgi:hypothetical protein